ncbi:MAG: type VI secretion system contractile sheath large subunit [Deltaproteobacteria bacterium]|nr:type VI secretion system contractile sheath large subunit [Deltaproteobacteria bacterium]
MSTDDKTGVRVRWLVAGAFTANPSGRRFTVSPNSFASTLEATALKVDATVPDRLGDGAKRSYPVAFGSLKAFQASDVIASVPALAGLSALGVALAQTDATKRPDPVTAVAKVIELVGDGKLAAALKTKLNVTPPAPSAAPAPAAAPASTTLDSLLSADSTPLAPPSAGTAVSSFLKAMRGPSTTATQPAAGRGARDVIEAEVFGTAVDILRSPEVSALESAWRGLKLLVDQCPENAGIGVEVLDVDAAGTLDAIRAALPEVPEDEAPDAIFVFDAVDDPARLQELANLGADNDIPVVAGVTSALFGQKDPHAVSARIEDDDGSLPSAWKELRADEASRWLAVVSNRPVLRTEGTGAARRVVFGSPVAALGAMLSASYHKSGAFARIVGPQGALKAAGSYELPSGRDAGNLVPTETFYSIRAQSRLAELGIIGLGSGRNSDAIILSSMPTARRGDDLVPLSAQVLTGRVVRFARWVLAQLPPGAEEPEVKLLFEQAAAVFLFPTAQEAARLEAQVVTQGEQRSVVLSVSARADLAGIPFHLGFGLPLK